MDLLILAVGIYLNEVPISFSMKIFAALFPWEVVKFCDDDTETKNRRRGALDCRASVCSILSSGSPSNSF